MALMAGTVYEIRTTGSQNAGGGFYDRSLSGSIAASASLSGSLLTPGGGSVTAIFLMLKKRR